MRIRILALAMAATWVGGGPAGATLVGEADIPAMVGAADVVVSGRAHHIVSQWNEGGVSQALAISVDRILKGAPPSGMPRLAVRHMVLDAGGREIADRQYGVFFLRRASGGYATVDPQHPALVALPDGSGKPASADPLAAIVAELAAVLNAPAGSLVGQEAKRQAAEALGSLPYSVAGSTLRDLVEAGDPPAALWALSGLFRMAEAEPLEAYLAKRLKAVVPALLDPSPDARAAVSAMAAAMRGRLDSASAVPALSRLLRSRHVGVRRAAASALGDMASRSVVRPLAEVALDDSDREVRYFAVLGLHDATGIGTAPTPAAFEKTEGEIRRALRRSADGRPP